MHLLVLRTPQPLRDTSSNHTTYSTLLRTVRESYELDLEILQFWTRCTNLLRTEDGDDSDETKTRLPHRAEMCGQEYKCASQTSQCVM